MPLPPTPTPPPQQQHPLPTKQKTQRLDYYNVCNVSYFELPD